MYRPSLNNRDKSGAIAGVIAIHVGLAFAFLHMSGTVDLGDPQRVMRVFDVRDTVPPPPPPPPPQLREEQKPKPKDPEGGAPANIRSEATPVVAPKPRIVLPAPSPVVVSETPRQGAAPTQGAADVRGPGTGAGGSGSGTGTGSGAGSGGGGAGSRLASRSRLVTPVLTGRNFPRDMLRAWPRGVDIFTRLRVDADGVVIQCIVDRGTGNPMIDDQVCNQIRSYLRFQPALDESGRRVADWAGYRQAAPR